jgi:2-polyprenyl-6-methoxyphenol hydroxylase-like FAD-dependent oxidoreductase
MTILPLGEIIQILYRHCLEREEGLIDVRFNHEVTDVGQDDNSAYVDVNIKGEGGSENARITADYVVGCDGASSAVRRSLFGRDWPGQTLPYRFVVQNVGLSLEVMFQVLMNNRSTTMVSRSIIGTVEITW